MLRKLGKYELLEEIGHGGMATVYRARDVNLDREVAIKVMHPHLRKTPEARVRFTREARSVARLKHPNVLEIYDYGGEDEEEAFIAAELLTGPTLKVYVEEGPALPAEIAACFGILIARALAAAHEKQIVHRDVKPENVLLHEDRTVKLTDFGIAQMVDAQSFTATGQILGSPGHMAPEQIEGGTVDPRTDVFSLGTVLYFLALRRLPFTGRNPHQILKRIVDGEYPEPLRMDPAIGARFAGIIDQAMARDPQARFATAAEVEGALAGFLAEMGIDDPEETLAHFLADPEAAAPRLRQDTLARLLTLARAAAARGDRQAALRHCNRLLALDDGNAEALELVQRMGRSSRTPLVAAGVAGALLLLAVGGWAATRPHDVVEASADAGPVDAGALALAPEDLGSAVDSGSSVVAEGPVDAGRLDPRPITHMAAPLPAGPRRVVFRPTPGNVQIAIDGGDFRPFGPDFRFTELQPGVHRLQIKSTTECCEDLDERINVPRGAGDFEVRRTLDFSPALLVVHADRPGTVEVAGTGAVPAVQGTTGSPLNVPMGPATASSTQNRRFTVTGRSGGVYTGTVRLQANEPASVTVQLSEGEPG